MKIDSLYQRPTDASPISSVVRFRRVMPLLQPFQIAADVRPPARQGAGAPVLAGAVGSLAILILAATGRTDTAAAAFAAAIVFLVGIGLSRLHQRSRERTPMGPGISSSSPSQSAAREWDAQTYLSALELAPNPVMVISAEEADDLASRRINFANAAARDLLRVPREGALLVAAVRNPDVLEAIDESLFGGLHRIMTYETGGSQNRYWRVWTNPLPSTPTRSNLALVILRDETDIRLNERMRADFLANASHELRTPLASLAGFIETLRGHAKDDVAARERFLAIMGRQAERMARLIDDLLSLSRIELNEHIRPSGACDLVLATTDVVDALGPQLAAKSIRLEVRLPERNAAVLIGDRDQIVQVIQNLLDNAIKYSSAGQEVRVEVVANLSFDTATALRSENPRLASADGGRMSLQTPNWAGAERYAVLRVHDEGSGMAREHLPRLTERFYRVEGQKGGGTGLGLAIVKHVVNRHRGGFFVESAPGKGAMFCVYFPMATLVPGGSALDATRLSERPRTVLANDSVALDSESEMKLS